MLLEAAGRTSSPVRNRQKLGKSRMKDGAEFSDGGSNSREEDSDDGAGAVSKKPPRCASHVPLKKRLDLSRRGSVIFESFHFLSYNSLISSGSLLVMMSDDLIGNNDLIALCIGKCYFTFALQDLSYGIRVRK